MVFHAEFSGDLDEGCSGRSISVRTRRGGIDLDIHRKDAGTITIHLDPATVKSLAATLRYGAQSLIDHARREPP